MVGRAVTLDSGKIQTAMVRVANGKSRQRASKTRLNAICVATTVVTIKVMPSMLVTNSGVRAFAGPMISRNVGSARPDIAT